MGREDMHIVGGGGVGWDVLALIRLNVQLNPAARILLLLPWMLTGLLRPELNTQPEKG